MTQTVQISYDDFEGVASVTRRQQKSLMQDLLKEQGINCKVKRITRTGKAENRVWYLRCKNTAKRYIATVAD